MDRRADIIREEFGEELYRAYLSTFPNRGKEETNEYTRLLWFIPDIYEYVCFDYSLDQLVNSWVTRGLDDNDIEMIFRIFEIDTGIDVSKERKDFIDALREYRGKENG